MAYWHEFELPKIFVPAIENSVKYSIDLKGYYGNDKTNIIPTNDWRYIISILNSSLSWWITQQTFAGRQGGFFEFKPMYVSQIPIPPANNNHKLIAEGCVNVIIVKKDPRFEQLINGLVYELFFPEDLHKANIQLFAEAERAGISKLATLEGEKLLVTANELAGTIFSTSHPIYSMLFDLQGIDVVRIIEGKD